MNERKLAALDIAIAVATLVLLASIALALPTLSRRCSSSMAQLQQAIIVWWAAAIVLACFVYASFKLPWKRIATRLLSLSAFLLLVGVALPNLDFGSADRSREKRALADMRTIASVLEEYHSETGSYPITVSVRDVRKYSQSHLSGTDPWGSQYIVRSSAGSYSIASHGICGTKPLVISR
jgi:type II secretion system (T2SS) protein G